MYYSMNGIIELNNKKYSAMEKEFIRKSIHMSVALLPFIVSLSYNLAVSLLMIGSFVYLISEFLRTKGKSLGLITYVTRVAARSRDNGVTFGPITLAVGSLIPLLIFNQTAFACGVFALAFGDGLSSVTGKLWGKHKIPFTGGKSFIGSFTCFVMILSTTYGITFDFKKALLAAFGGTLVELIPFKDLDNLLIPVTVALLVSL